MSQLPAGLRARVLADIQRQPAPTRGMRNRVNFAVAFAGALVSLGLFGHFGFARSRALDILGVLTAGGGAASLVALWFAASRGRSMLGRSRAGLAAVVLLAPAALLGSALGAAVMEGTVALAGGTAHEHVVCFAVTMLLAAGPFAATLYARRGTDPVHPSALGAAIGGAAGLCGGALIDLHCPITSFEHIGLAHALPLLVFAAIGALAGRRLLGIGPRS